MCGSIKFLKANYRPKQMSAKQLEDGLFRVYNWVYNERENVKRAKYFKNLCYRLRESDE